MGGQFRWEGEQVHGKGGEEDERQRQRREAEEELRQELLPFFGSRGKRGKPEDIRGITVVEKRPRSKDFESMLRYFYRSI